MGDKVIGEEFGKDDPISRFGRLFYRNVSVGPKFTNEIDGVYTFQRNSQMINAGTFLVRIKSRTGSGVHVKLDDVAYFFDGFDIDGEVGDLVQLERSNLVARIIDIDSLLSR